MEFGSKRSRRRKQIKIQAPYPSGLQFYSHPPVGETTLDEFEEIAFERLKILRSVERWNLSGHVKNSEDWVSKLYEDFGKNKFFLTMAEKNSKSDSDEVQKARRQDHISHFILRLVYCRTEENRRWFIAHETDLFRARFLNATKSDIRTFLTSNNLQYTSITPDEKAKERENLLASSMNVTGDNIEGMTFYKVPFTDALELVRKRKVYLKHGFAYVPEFDLVTLVINSFRTHLSHAMAYSCRALPEVESDERLMDILHDFDKRYTGKDYGSRKPEDMCHITPEIIDTLSTKSFPPCMRQLNDTLRTTHHLKHNGRLIYGLFLKAAGLKLEDAFVFWRSHFLQNMDVDTFEKRYSYGIRYNYGKEGKKTDFSPYGCIRIIMSNVAPGDSHGCPFKHCDTTVLRQRLTAYKVTQQAVDEIVDLVNKRHYQIACQRYWEATHGVPIDTGINHPNQFFEESQKFLNGGVLPTQGKREHKHKVETTPTVMYSSQASTQPPSSTTSTSDMDMCFDDDAIEAAMLDQCMEESSEL